VDICLKFDSPVQLLAPVRGQCPVKPGQCA
jgi:hypothetical protein